MNRKQFLWKSAMGMAAAYIPIKRLTGEKDLHSNMQNGYMEMVREAMKYPKIDVHNHIHNLSTNLKKITKSCKMLGLTHVALSNIDGRPKPKTIQGANNIVLEAEKRYPNLILGQCFINPGNSEEALTEIERCFQNGMVMLGELYDKYKVSDPVYYPIIEKCIKLNIPLLVHGAAPLGNWRWRKGYPTNNPLTTSTAEDFVEIAKRYPEAMIIYGHLGGGGDWEYAIKVLREAPSVYVDISGSVCDARMVDMAVNELGVDRLLFGTDTNYECGVGKIMWADLTEKEREKVFFDNFNNILKKANNNVS